jgi:hypothetical protein
MFYTHRLRLATLRIWRTMLRLVLASHTPALDDKQLDSTSAAPTQL